MSDAIYAPWDYESDETSSGQSFCVYDRCGDRVSGSYVTEDQARLIAAAPDLLEVAKTALRILERDFPNGQAVIDARAAIAKAEPRS